MASTTSTQKIFFLLLSSFAIIRMASAGDPDITSDFITPSNVTGPVDGNFFTFIGMRVLVGAQPTPNLKVTKASMAEFPALNGQISAFGSANAGTVSLPITLFATGIDNTILAKAFKTDVATIQALKSALAPKP
ncbi:hypothetical protein ACOSP7_016082 [Xanthoceras sorbifolium]